MAGTEFAMSICWRDWSARGSKNTSVAEINDVSSIVTAMRDLGNVSKVRIEVDNV